MFATCRPSPTLRSFRAMTLPLLLIGLSLGGCNGADNPLAPADSPSATAGDPAMNDYVQAAGTTQRIVFLQYNSSERADLFKMDPQGSSLVRVTNLSEESMHPAWSRDNQHIAMTRARTDASNVTHVDIYVTNADGSQGHWLRPTPFPYNMDFPCWSPDGSRLLVTVDVNLTSYVGWIDVATGQVNLFNAAAGGVKGWQGSYDKPGSHIIYTTGQTIDQINADGTNHKIRISSATAVRDPKFSPDGQRIAYTKSVNNNDEIFVKNFSTGTNKRLTFTAGTDARPTWSPDGSTLAFDSQRTGKSQVWTMTATGGNPQRITHTTNPALWAAWSY